MWSLSGYHYGHKETMDNIIIESVDSISRDGPDTPIYVIQYKKPNNSDPIDF